MDKFLEDGTPKYRPLILERGSTPKFKVFSVEDSELANADLLRLIDDEGVQSIKSKSVFSDNRVLNTEVGDVELNVRYRPEYSDLYITSTETEISGLSLRITLDNFGKPQQLILIDDLNNFFATLFCEAGFTIFSTLGPPDKTSLNSFIEKRSRIKQIDSITESLKADMNKTKRIDEPYFDKTGFFVRQGFYKIDKVEAPLATAGLNTCAVLVVINTDRKLHYLAHIDSNVSEEEIKKSLEALDLSMSEIYIMDGPSSSGASKNIVGCVIDLSGLENLKFLTTSEQGIFPGLTSYNGKLYFGPSNPDSWRKEASPFNHKL